MTLSQLTDPTAVVAALKEAEKIGRAKFQEKYDFGQATKFPVLWNEKLYDSKAVAAVAHGYQFPDQGPLRKNQLHGGVAPTGAATKLMQLGFEVLNTGKDGATGHWVYYWAEYHENVAGGPFLQLNQSSLAMSRIQPGDTVWAVTSNGRRQAALAARFVVKEVGENRPGTNEADWGRYFFRSAANEVVYFQLADQPNVGSVLNDIGMAKRPDVVGQSLQGGAGVRPVLTGADAIMAFAAALPIDGRLTADEAIAVWSDTAPYSPAVVGNSTPARREQTRELYVRDQAAVRDLKERYKGLCQINGKKPLDGVVGDITEAHHVEWLTRGGSDTADNMVVLSPDWHRAIHACNATFDWSDLSFTVNGRKVPLAVNKHLKSRSS